MGLEGEENDGSGGDGDQPPANELKIVDVTVEGPSSKTNAMEASLKLSLEADRAPTTKATVPQDVTGENEPEGEKDNKPKYGETVSERATNPDFWGDMGYRFLFGKPDNTYVKSDFPFLVQMMFGGSGRGLLKAAKYWRTVRNLSRALKVTRLGRLSYFNQIWKTVKYLISNKLTTVKKIEGSATAYFRELIHSTKGEVFVKGNKAIFKTKKGITYTLRRSTDSGLPTISTGKKVKYKLWFTSP